MLKVTLCDVTGHHWLIHVECFWKVIGTQLQESGFKKTKKKQKHLPLDGTSQSLRAQLENNTFLLLFNSHKSQGGPLVEVVTSF